MAHRTALREFQQNLSRRMANAAISALQNTSVLTVQSGGEAWIMALTDAGEVLPVPKLTAAPLIKPWYAGVANVRGSLYSVVDFGAFRGAAPVRLGPDSRLLLCASRLGLNAALLVDRILGLRDDREFTATTRDDMSQDVWQKCSKR